MAEQSECRLVFVIGHWALRAPLRGEVPNHQFQVPNDGLSPRCHERLAVTGNAAPRVGMPFGICDWELGIASEARLPTCWLGSRGACSCSAVRPQELSCSSRCSTSFRSARDSCNSDARTCAVQASAQPLDGPPHAIMRLCASCRHFLRADALRCFVCAVLFRRSGQKSLRGFE